MNITDDADGSLVQGKIDATEAYIKQVLGNGLRRRAGPGL